MRIVMPAALRSEPPVSHALSGVLRSKGFEVEDFEVEEDQGSAWSDLFDGIGGVLRVRCWSTGEERVYPTGSGSAWLGAFLMDLGGGHFARATRALRASRG
ncbi:MAG: hypothetical protein ABIQ06_03430 [Caldimonas sp.]